MVPDQRLRRCESGFRAVSSRELRVGFLPLLRHGLALCLIFSWCQANATADESAQQPGSSKPNIVFVLFDDLGYGQPRLMRPESEFKMPRLERLAKEGMRFTDAHSASAVCTPTRYGILTGRYPWRIDQYGVLTTYSPPIIPPTRMTMARMLQQSGYQTACIGKWHLGLEWANGKPGKQDSVPVGERIVAGPNQLGFDYFYGFTHARNIGTIIEQDRVVQHVKPVDNQPLMVARAVNWIAEASKANRPFFLYFPMCPPHTPVAPSSEYSGKSGVIDSVGNDAKYGDWIMQGDGMLGQLLDALDQAGVAGNTLVVATSDNGAEHRSYPPLRDSKRSIYEGGHRVPLVVRWPDIVTPQTTCTKPVCLNDFWRTFAAIVGATIPDQAAEDSFSLLGLLRDPNAAAPRLSTVHQSMQGDLALRQGDWKLIFRKNRVRELYRLSSDLGEQVNLASGEQERVQAMQLDMLELITNGRSVPGPIAKDSAFPAALVESD